MADGDNNLVRFSELKRYDEKIKSYINNKTNNSSSITELNELENINITSPQDGEVLKYNANNSKWENSADNSGTSSISTDLLSHTSWSSGSEGELRYELQSDGSKHLYECENGTWSRVYDVAITIQGDSTINTPFNKIIVSTTDIGEGQPLDAGTIVFVVE